MEERARGGGPAEPLLNEALFRLGLVRGSAHPREADVPRRGGGGAARVSFILTHGASPVCAVGWGERCAAPVELLEAQAAPGRGTADLSPSW